MKKQYIKPAMREVRIRQTHIICASLTSIKAVKNIESSDLNWNSDGFDGGDDM